METHASALQKTWQKRILALCWLSYALSYLCRTNLSIALPEMTAGLHWPAAKAGMIGSVFFISYGIGHFVNGLLGDRVPVKKFMMLGLAGTSFCNLLIGFFPYYTVILIVWLVNGVFLSTLWGPVVRAVAIWYAPSERNVPAMLVSASSLGGYLVSWAGLGAVVQFTGWQGAFFFPGAVTLAFTVWFFLRMSDAPERMGFQNYERTDGQAQQPAAQSVGLWALVRRERLFFICFAAAAQGIIKDGITLWEPTILTNLHHLPISMISAASALIPVCSFAGIYLSGKLMKQYAGNERIPGIALFSATALLCMLFFLMMGRSVWLDIFFFGAISALLYGVNTLLLTYIPLRLSSCGCPSSVAGLFNFCAYLGAGGAGILLGFFADIGGWQSTVAVWLVLCVLGALAVALGARRDAPHR